MKILFPLFLFLCLNWSATAQVELEELNKFENKIIEIETKFETEQTKLLDEITKLNEELISLSTDQFGKRIEALEKKQQNLDLLKTNEQDKEMALYQTKYEAGVLIIKDIIESMQKLKSQYDAVSFNDSYRSLSNPHQYPLFAENIKFLKQKLIKKGLTLPPLNLGNPILNSVYGLAQGLVSDQEDKDEKIQELICILDFTSIVSQDLNVIKFDLIYLQYSIDKMLLDYQELFKSYTNLVGYGDDFNTYIRDADEDLSDKIEAYFKNTKTKETAMKEKDLKIIKFQLQKVMDAYLKYEMFTSQNSAYYEKFDLIIRNIEPTCGNARVQADMHNKYDEVRGKLLKAKNSFNMAFSGTIKQSYLKELIQ